MSRNTTPAELRVAPGSPWPSGARGDPAADVAARRLAWQRAFESALRLPWCGFGHLGASADAPSARPAPVARPPAARDASGVAPSASPEQARRSGAPAPAASPTAGRLGRAASPAAPPGAQRRSAAEDEAPHPRRAAEDEDPGPRDAPPAVAPREPGEALAPTHAGAESGPRPSGTQPGVVEADPRGRAGWARAPEPEEADRERLLVPGIAIVAAGQRHPAMAVDRPEPTTPAAGGACSQVQVPVWACEGTPLATPAPAVSGPAAARVEPPLEEGLLAREQERGSSGARNEGGTASAREPVRCHAEWGEDGVRVWIGLDRDRAQSQPQLTRALVEQARTLVEAQGGRVLTVICNGKVVWGRRPPAGAGSLHERANGRNWEDGRMDISSKEEDS